MWRFASAARRLAAGAPASVSAAIAAGLVLNSGFDGADAASSYLNLLGRPADGAQNSTDADTSTTSTQYQHVEEGSDEVVVDVASINTHAEKIKNQRIAAGRLNVDEEDEKVNGASGRDADRASTSGIASTVDASAAYKYSPSKAVKATPAVVEISTKLDVASIDKEVAIVAVVRGCHPAVVDSVLSSVNSACTLDDRGFRFYAVTDSTPSDVCEYLEKALNAEIPEPYVPPSAPTTDIRESKKAAAEDDDGLDLPSAIPVIAIFDRAGATKTKYIMPASDKDIKDTSSGSNGSASNVTSGVVVEPVLSTPKGEQLLPPLSQVLAAAAAARSSVASAAASAAESSASSGSSSNSVASEANQEPSALPPLTPAESIVLSSVPYPSEIKEFAEKFVFGRLRPSLLGAPRPAGDQAPLHPYLTQVVSSSWYDIVLDPKKDVMLEAYLTHCPMCMCLAPRVRMLAQLADAYFPHVRVAVMNVDDNDRPHNWMPGPAFPTIQLFNGGNPATSTFTKLRGPTCKLHAPRSASTAPSSPSGSSSANNAAVHLGSAAAFEAGHVGIPKHSHAAKGDSTPSSSSLSNSGNGSGNGIVSGAGIARTTLKGSPVCVPAVDFTHPTAPGKMALPSVTELLGWVSSHSSKPFDPSTVRVPATALLHAADRFKDLFPSPPPTPASALGPEPTVPSSLDNTSAALSTVPLSALAADMDVEARVIEYAVFDLFFFEHILELYSKAVGIKSAEGINGSNIGAGPMPDYATEDRRAVHAPFKSAVQKLRHYAIERGAYGNAQSALDAMDECSDIADRAGIRGVARAYQMDQEEMKTIAAAVPLAARLAAAEAQQKQKQQLQ